MSSVEEKEEDSFIMDRTVKFDVGGKLYEISKSLLERFPDTVLTERVEKASSLSTPIFVDRDPDRFAFCPDYMRDNGQARSYDLIQEEEQGIVTLENNVALFRINAQEWEKKAQEQEKEIKMKELALTCREKTCRNTKDRFVLPKPDATALGRLHRRHYFVRCCEKLALEIIIDCSDEVSVRRKTSNRLK